MMKQKIVIFLAMLFCSHVLAYNFTLSESSQRKDYSFFQFGYNANQGVNFTQAFADQKISSDTIKIRLLGVFSQTTNDELLAYFRKNLPQKTQQALKSSGNMHNPAIKPLSHAFDNAFKATTFFTDIQQVMNNRCFVLEDISGEKFHIHTKPFSVILPDIWLTFIKKPCNDE